MGLAAAMTKLATWRGKPLDDLSREELIEALQWFAEQHRIVTSDEAIRERALGRVAAMRLKCVD